MFILIEVVKKFNGRLGQINIPFTTPLDAPGGRKVEKVKARSSLARAALFKAQSERALESPGSDPL